jgi:hypothetical protein
MEQDQRIDNRMGLVKRIIGLWEAILRRVSRKPFQDHAVDPALEPHRQLDRAAHGVGGSAKDVFRYEVIAPPHRDVAALAMVDRIHRNIAAGISGPDDQHPLALEHIGIPVGARMHQFARKAAFEFRHVRLRQGAIGNHHPGKLRFVLRSISLAPGYPPAPHRSCPAVRLTTPRCRSDNGHRSRNDRRISGSSS